VKHDDHPTVLLNEAVDALALVGARADGTYLDGTFGRGGHSRLILTKLSAQGRLLATDRDPQAIAAYERSELQSDKRFSLTHTAFSDFELALREHKIDALDGALLDLGVSMPQLKQGERGFSFMADGPLDMRMDPTSGQSVSDWLNEAEESQIAEVIDSYGEERFAKQIARKIAQTRSSQPIRTTGQLAALVAATVRSREPGHHPATRTFQAFRLFANQELEELALALPKLFAALKPQGRLVIISFHSLEDRIVKQAFKQLTSVAQPPKGVPVRAADLGESLAIDLGRVKPSAAEVAANPSSRSAVMRTIAKRG
jgi:16S rRNA (cytosine1402-N4)-methyltransferase